MARANGKLNKPERIVSAARSSAEVIQEIRGMTPVSLVSFSRGKDAISTYLAIRDSFAEVIPYHYDCVVPKLEFVEESLRAFEKVMGRRIIRLPAPNMWRSLNALMYQPPDTIDLINSLELPVLTQDDLQRYVCEDSGLDYETTWNALGMRAKDSMQRALYFQKSGPVNHTRRVYYPVFDYSKQDVVDAIARAGWKLPIDYTVFNASFDGLYIKYLLPIKRHFPRDYERILTMFPLAELEVLRYESAVRHGEQAPL